MHNYFYVENITTYYTLKKIVVHNYFNDFFFGPNYYFYLSNVQNNIQMLNFYTDLNDIFIKIYTHKYNTAIV